MNTKVFLKNLNHQCYFYAEWTNICVYKNEVTPSIFLFIIGTMQNGVKF